MLSLLIHADSLREDAGRTARQRIEEHYLWSGIAAQIERTYLEMMGWQTGETSAPGRPAMHADRSSRKLIA